MRFIFKIENVNQIYNSRVTALKVLYRRLNIVNDKIFNEII